MTKEMTIQEGNRIIAEFMEYDIADNIKWEEEEDKGRPRPWMIERPGTVDDLEYHTSWDWQVPVWSKLVKEVKEWVKDKPEYVLSKYLWFVAQYEEAIFCDDKSKGHKVVTEMLEWYNTNNKNS
jgi:predicted house-cleaning noncanonical NTP pyrophosphatase (MazG superfamily)